MLLVNSDTEEILTQNYTRKCGSVSITAWNLSNRYENIILNTQLCPVCFYRTYYFISNIKRALFLGKWKLHNFKEILTKGSSNKPWDS